MDIIFMGGKAVCNYNFQHSHNKRIECAKCANRKIISMWYWRLYVLKRERTHILPTGCIALNSVSLLKVREKTIKTRTTTTEEKYLWNWLLVGHEHNFSFLIFYWHTKVGRMYSYWILYVWHEWMNEWGGSTYSMCGAASTWPQSHHVEQ